MNLSLSSLGNLPKLRQRDITLIILVVVCLLAALWYFYMFNPTRNRITTLDTEIAAVQAEVTQGEIAKRSLPELEASLAQAKQARDDFLSQLPKESEVSKVLATLREKASDHEIQLTSINQTTATSTVQDVRAIGFSLSTTGSYGSNMGFLDSLETLKRFTKVQSVNFTAQNEGTSDNPELSSNYEINVFVYSGATGTLE